MMIKDAPNAKLKYALTYNVTNVKNSDILEATITKFTICASELSGTEYRLSQEKREVMKWIDPLYYIGVNQTSSDRNKIIPLDILQTSDLLVVFLL